MFESFMLFWRALQIIYGSVGLLFVIWYYYLLINPSYSVMVYYDLSYLIRHKLLPERIVNLLDDTEFGLAWILPSIDTIYRYFNLVGLLVVFHSNIGVLIISNIITARQFNSRWLTNDWQGFNTLGIILLQGIISVNAIFFNWHLNTAFSEFIWGVINLYMHA